MGSSSAKTLARRQDSTQLRRQWKLLRLLWGSRVGKTALELSRELDTSKSTIERDLATLQQDFAITTTSEKQNRQRYHYVGENEPVPMARFGPLELLALEAGRAALGPLAGTLLADSHKAADAKARLSTRSSDKPECRRAASIFRVITPGVERTSSDLVDDLVDATARGIRVIIDYRRSGCPTSRCITTDILRLVTFKGCLYAFCRSPNHGGFYWLAARRMTSCTLLGKAIEPISDSVIDGYLDGAFGLSLDPDNMRDVEIVFAASVADRILAMQHHPDERVEHLDDGRAVYRLRTSSKYEILTWVLSFAGNAELKAPADWRQELVERAMRAAGVHGGSNGPSESHPRT